MNTNHMSSYSAAELAIWYTYWIIVEASQNALDSGFNKAAAHIDSHIHDVRFVYDDLRP